MKTCETDYNRGSPEIPLGYEAVFKLNSHLRIVHYNQWHFIIDNDEELKIIEGLSYKNYKIKNN